MPRHESATGPNSDSDGDLRIQLLGGFRVTARARVLEDSQWRLRKAAAMLKLLALSPKHQLHRDLVLEYLWPGLELSAAANNFHHTLHALRRILTPDGRSNWLRLQGDVLTLGPAGQLWVDVQAFESASVAAHRAQDPAPYYAALELYTGELLPTDRYEDWTAGRREALHYMYLGLLLELARLHETRQERQAAIDALRRVVESEPSHEEAHTGLMRLYALSGQRHQALRQYGHLKDALQRELDAEPEPYSKELYQQIRSGLFTSRVPEPPAAREADTASAPLHNLPAPLTSFVGREHEVAEVRRLLATTRLLTLVGTGGCGKTRLALEVARGLVAKYADGVWLIELAGLSDPRLVPEAVSGVLGLRADTDRPLIDVLSNALRSKRMLLVLDNCEHLLEACAHLVQTLLSSCPDLRVLATSREALGASGELHWRVPSLSIPPAGPVPPVQRLGEYGSVQLFIERAQFRLPTLELAQENAPAVLQICQRLEGIPLAIELAAARVSALSLEQIAARLDNSLRLLTSGGRLTAPRHKTLRGVFDWSYKLLSEAERQLFARLSVFVGGWELSAAEAVGAVHEPERECILDLLSDLVDKSLILAEPGAQGAVRYRLLEPARQYAREKLEESGEADATLLRHALHFLELAEAAETELTGAHQVRWLERLETEHDNLRAALSWTLEHDRELGARLAGALWRFWYMRGYLSEGREWLDEMLSSSSAVPPSARAEALRGAGGLAYGQTDYERAVVRLEESLLLYTQLGDRHGVAACLNNLAVIAHERGDYECSREIHEQCLELRRQLGDKQGIGQSVSNLGAIYLAQGDYQRARALFEEGVALDREAGDESGVAIGLNNLAEVARHQGDFDRAMPLYLVSLPAAQRVGEKLVIASCLEGMASIAHARGRSERAGLLYGAAGTLRESIGRPVYPGEQADYERALAVVRAAAGEETFDAARAEGLAMTPERAIEYALSLAEPATPACSTSEETSQGQQVVLTRREREIVGQITEGLTNRQIAHQLVLSERTVDTHTANLMRKLGLRSRTQVAAWAAQQGLFTQR